MPEEGRFLDGLWGLVLFGLGTGCGEATSDGAAALPNPVHVVAGAEPVGADGTEAHPFPLLDNAAAAIELVGAWQGTVLVHTGRYEHPVADVVLPPTADLEIQPGTTFALGPNISLHAQRGVKALGTETEPVVFTWLSEGQHWGAFTLTESPSPDNVFDHAVFEHGYDTTFGGLSRRGALSLDHSSTRISHCTFRNNEGGDALNFTAGTNHVEFSEFTDNASNALLAYDASDGIEIDHNSFFTNANDAIKVSSSSAFIHDNLISGCADKGISVTARSFGVIEHNRIEGCYVGIVDKDGATPTIRNNTLYGNEIGFVAYEAVAGLGAGKGTFTGNIVWNSSVDDLYLDPTSETVFSYSCIEDLSYTDPVTGEVGDNANVNGLPGDGEGMLSEGNGCDDPLFVNPGALDFHLQSQAGRFDSTNGTWVKDELTSPCIDAGPPSADVGDEAAPNGSRINLGYDGGTAEASRSPR